MNNFGQTFIFLKINVAQSNIYHKRNIHKIDIFRDTKNNAL